MRILGASHGSILRALNERWHDCSIYDWENYRLWVDALSSVLGRLSMDKSGWFDWKLARNGICSLLCRSSKAEILSLIKTRLESWEMIGILAYAIWRTTRQPKFACELANLYFTGMDDSDPVPDDWTQLKWTRYVDEGPLMCKESNRVAVDKYRKSIASIIQCTTCIRISPLTELIAEFLCLRRCIDQLQEPKAVRDRQWYADW